SVAPEHTGPGCSRSRPPLRECCTTTIMTYVFHRLLRAALLLLGVSLLCFLFTEMAPGSFFDEMRLNTQIYPATITSLRARFGLDRPLVVRYFRWTASAMHGDLGYSIAYNAP